MAATNLEACVAVLRFAIEGELGYPADSVSDGRRPRSSRKTPWAHIQRQHNERAVLLSGARLREYAFDVHLLRSASDLQEEGNVDKALQADLEKLHDAFHGKGLSTFPSLRGLETVRAEIQSRDESLDTRQEQEAVLRVVFPIFEEP